MMPIYRIPGSTSAADGGGVRGGAVLQHGDQSTSAQQDRQTGVQQRQVLRPRAGVMSLHVQVVHEFVTKHQQRIFCPVTPRFVCYASLVYQ